TRRREEVKSSLVRELHFIPLTSSLHRRFSQRRRLMADIKDRAKQDIEHAGNKAQEWTKQASNKAQEMTEQAAHRAEETAQSTSNQIKEGGKKVKDAGK